MEVNIKGTVITIKRFWANNAVYLLMNVGDEFVEIKSDFNCLARS